MGHIRLNNRAFSRLLELVLVLIIMFALITTVTQTMPPLVGSKENLQVLDRYATDFRNMICNSDKDRETILLNNSLSDINNTMNYIFPPGVKHRVVVINVSDGTVVQSVGDPLTEGSSVVTSSCVVAKGDTKYKAEVQVWY